ncbi:Fe2+ transport system protein FeoA [Sulfobacillus thermosulfidooxidans DSM 9293]|uniref:Fe2+ transport system protein FeoA n=1 Tax=Sulfobacillus thermosulfidooxidans (strain DSM 9293 / VKM B-1269 / AT-1) TaxID=929705 RepID=A0A1W1W5Z3_SULTA|nr:FeoA family protein [Sulfobacillus thermosulfidooxidans]SMC01717.1 Fe2+ transport system protein FeoA [Sulfobacillus thermosulfidooxidans DSM 9293]
MTLLEADITTLVKIEQISLAYSRMQAIRLGLGPGAQVRVVQKLPHGPVVLNYQGRTIAVGYELAKNILVTPSDERQS